MNTNCKNCAAVIPSHGLCNYCGTHNHGPTKSIPTRILSVDHDYPRVKPLTKVLVFLAVLGLLFCLKYIFVDSDLVFNNHQIEISNSKQTRN